MSDWQLAQGTVDFRNEERRHRNRSYAREAARRVEAVTSDHLPACPRCGDLLEAGALICTACGCYVTLDKGKGA